MSIKGAGSSLKVLRKRLAYIDKKIETGQCSDGAMSFFKEERGALAWAVQVLDTLNASQRFLVTLPAEVSIDENKVPKADS